MKKALVLAVILFVAAAVVAGVFIAQKGDVQKKADDLTSQVAALKSDLDTAKADAQKAMETAAGAVQKSGLGFVTSIGSIADAGEKNGSAQVNTTVCSLNLDGEGKIASVQFDVQQTKIQFTAEGKLIDLPEVLKTKIEKGDEYGMRAASGIGKEWFEQIHVFEEYCVGKTVEEVLGMETYERDASHPKVPAAEDMKSTVTISVGDYLAALEKAAANAK